jgi:hypothetical protein
MKRRKSAFRGPAMLAPMQRREWFELHDHRLYPGFLRDLATDALEAIWDYTNSYRVIVPRLRTAMEEAGTHQIIDLCSGGGGPWLRLREQFAATERFPVKVLLTDKYPNKKAFTSHRTEGEVQYHPFPVDASEIPVELNGFRTIFSTFHHFNPKAARAILADAVSCRQGIGVFEAAKPSLCRILATLAVPALCWYVTPRIRPFRLLRLFWTFLLPIVPFTLLADGILSCLRAYSFEDLHELTNGLADTYQWEIGEEHGGRIGITYLIGRPL